MTMRIYQDFKDWQEGRDNFNALLFRMIQKADPENKAKLGLAFPHHVLMFEAWHSSDPEPLNFQLKEFARRIESLDEITARNLGATLRAPHPTELFELMTP